MPKLRKRYWGGFFPEYELRRRETGFNCNIGWEGKLKYKLYSSLHPCNSWDPIFSCNSSSSGSSGCHHGGIFNLEFSPDGKQLIAACERKAIMIFDPLTRKQIFDVSEAHSSCVNGIKFLDNRVFATCSDDKTVTLWDVRNLRRKIKSLFGHNNWVKNIEYSSEEGLLVTSGFDGKILGWNINSYTEESSHCTELFRMQGLMRIKLTPDSSKLIICTTAGYMLMVHDLSLADLPNDLMGFRPYVYRLMQMSSSPVAQPFDFKSLFKRKRNRIEFISDFPPGNYAEVIHSLQVHPQAWCVLSRNTSSGDSSEWTCVHDIQDLQKNEDDLEEEAADVKKSIDSEEATTPRSSFPVHRGSHDLQLALTINPRLEVMLRQRPSSEILERHEGRPGADGAADDEAPSSSRNSRDGDFDLRLRFSTSIDVLNTFRDIERRLEEERNANSTNAGEASLSGTSSNFTNSRGRSDHEGAAASPLDFRLRQRRRRGNDGSSERRDDYRNVFVIRPELHTNRSVLLLNPFEDYNPSEVYKPQEVVKNAARLTNYIEEPNKGKGFIKELCFSSDGRLICSPFDCGVRLMMFDEKCSELSHCVQKTPQSLCVISSNICHTNCVVSTKFSPVDCLLVSGCLNGKIVWHQPII